MPFQSEKQRKYLWANEPEIARDWTDTYGSRVKKDNGGIMNQIPFMTGFKLPDVWNQWQQHKLASNLIKEDPGTRDYHQLAAHDFMQRFPNTPNWLGKGLATGYQLASEFGKGILDPSRMSSFLPRALEEARLNRVGIEGLTPDQQARYDSFSKTFDPTIESMYPTDRSSGIWDAIKNEFGGSAEAADLSGMIPKNLEKTIEEGMQSYKKSNEISPALRKAIEEGTSYNEWDMIPNTKYHGIPMRQISLNQDEEETFIDPNRIPGRIQKSVPRNRGMLERFRNKFYKPATSAAGGYNVSQLNKMNALGGYYSEPARQQRRLDARRTNILNRAAKGKPVGNVSKLLGKYGYKGTPGGGIQFTGRSEGSSTAGAGYSRSDSGWSSSPFRRGGLASLWQR